MQKELKSRFVRVSKEVNYNYDGPINSDFPIVAAMQKVHLNWALGIESMNHPSKVKRA